MLVSLCNLLYKPFKMCVEGSNHHLLDKGKRRSWLFGKEWHTERGGCGQHWSRPGYEGLPVVEFNHTNRDLVQFFGSLDCEQDIKTRQRVFHEVAS